MNYTINTPNTVESWLQDNDESTNDHTYVLGYNDLVDYSDNFKRLTNETEGVF